MKARNSLFLRVPKTASSSIVRCENTIHMKYYEVHETKKFFETNKEKDKIIYFGTRCYLNAIERNDLLFNFKKNNIFTFGFVRNPWDRAVSSWKWGNGTTEKWDMNFVDYCKKLKTCDLSPKNGIAKNGLLLHSCEQHPFLICKQKNLKADFIGRYETLQSDYDRICDHIGVSQIKLNHLKKTERGDYTEYYTDETIDIISEKYAKDIEYFGYKFGQ